MILFKCSCGAGLKVADEQAGQRFLCPSCMQEVAAPAESDPGCVLVYRDGGPADGFVVDAGSLEEMIAGGGLCAWDLVWRDDNWIPLGSVHRFPEEEAPEEDDVPEIALRLSELPPIEGYAPLPKGRRASPAGRRRGGRSGRGAWAGSFRRWFGKMGLRERVVFVVKTALVASILWIGIVRAGRIVNYARRRPAGVLVLSPSDRQCEMRVQGKSWEFMYPGSWAVDDEIYVAWGRRIAVEFREKPSSPVFLKLRCPVRPGSRTVVNPGGRHELGVYDLAGFREKRLASRDLERLGRAIADGRPPEAAARVAQQIQDLTAGTLLERCRAEFVRDDRYDLSTLVQARLGGRGPEEVGAAAPAAAARPCLCYPLRRNLEFRNGSVEYDPGDGRTPRQVRLAEKVFRLKRGRVASAAAGPLLRIGYPRDGLSLRLSGLTGKVAHQGVDFPGNWEYQADLRQRKWQWRWTFSGSAGGRRLTLVQKMDGSEKIECK